jgi:hypothetical protein
VRPPGSRRRAARSEPDQSEVVELVEPAGSFVELDELSALEDAASLDVEDVDEPELLELLEDDDLLSFL